MIASWFQLFIKQLDEPGDVPADASEHKYTWYEMSFYVYTLCTGAAVLFCFDTPRIFQDNLLRAMAATRRVAEHQHHAYLQCMVIQEVTRLYDKSVWTLRDHIRKIEKVRNTSDRAIEPSFDAQF